MSQPTGTPWWKSFLVGVFVLVVLVALLIGFFRTDDLRARWIVGLFLAICGALFVWRMIHDWRQDRRLWRLLEGREALDPEAFGKRYFGDVPCGPKAAAAVRRLLDEHLQRPLSGLRPDDALDYLCDWVDPLFVDELLRGYDLAAPSTWPEFCAFIEPLRTVRDLVEALAEKLRQPSEESHA